MPFTDIHFDEEEELERSEQQEEASMCEARSITSISNSLNAEPLVATQEDRWMPKSAEVVVVEAREEVVEWGFTTPAKQPKKYRGSPVGF